MCILKNKMRGLYINTLESSQDSDRQYLEVNTVKLKGGIPT